MPEGARDGILKGMYRFQRRGEAEGEAARAAVRQRRDPARGASRRRRCSSEVRRRRRRVERHQLQRAVSRRPRVRALEHAAPGRDAARAVRHAVPEGRAGRVRRGVRLREGAARLDRSLAAAAAHALGTDGFGRSENRAALREFFEVDSRYVVVATLARWRATARSTRRSCSRRSRRSTSIPRKPTRRFRKRLETADRDRCTTGLVDGEIST